MHDCRSRGTFDRAQLLEVLSRALDAQRDDPERLTGVLSIAVDGAMATDDAVGDAARDQVLGDVAASIQATVRCADTLAQCGGGRFAVLCESLGHAAEARVIAARVRALADPTGEAVCGLSVGVAIVTDPLAEPASILAVADRAMYRVTPAAPVPTSSPDRAGRDRFDSVDLIAAAAHELRTPLTSIAGFATTMRASRHKMTPAELDRSFAILERQTHRLGAMLDQLLDLGRHHNASPTLMPVDLAEVIAEALETSPPPHDVKVTMAGEQPASPLVAAAERTTITRVVVNLLTNAYRYGGPNIAIASHNGAADVTLTVQDDGPGVPNALERAMFVPFVRGEHNGATVNGSTGLGLALARSIAESFGGNLTYEAVRPHGACFTLKLPAATPSHSP